MNWSKPISERWEKRQQEIEARAAAYRLENQEITFTYDESGNITGAYIDGKFDAELTKEIQQAGVEALKGAGLGFADGVVTNNGKWAADMTLGERHIGGSYEGTPSYVAGQFAADLFSLFQGGAEFVGGGLWSYGGSAAAVVFSGGGGAVAVPAINTSGLALSAHGSSVVVSAWNSLGDGYFQKTNPIKSESPIWKELDNVKGKARKTSGTGKKKKYYEWDYTHNDIEVFDHKGNHLGSMEPVTGEMYKPPVPRRKMD